MAFIRSDALIPVTESPPLPLSRRRPRWALCLVLAGVLAGALALAAGCGYRQDVPALPGGAGSVTLQAIRNRTDVGELDVRLRAELTRRLADHAHVSLLPSDGGGLQLSIDLEQATLRRSLDPAQTSDRSFGYTLVGRMTLLDPRSGIRHVDGESIAVSVTRHRGAGVAETPAVRDEGWGRALAAFAEQVERRLLRSF